VENVEWTESLTANVDAYPQPGHALVGLQQRELAGFLRQDLHAAVAEQLGLSSLEGVMRTFGTAVAVWDMSDWYLKLRVTWLDTDRETSEVLSHVVVWNTLPCAKLVALGASIRDVPPEGLS